MKPGLNIAGQRGVAALALGVAMAPGCRLDGSWTRVEPAQASPRHARVIDAVTFTPDGRYTITETRGSERITTTGRYAFSGTSLVLNEEGDGSRTLICRRSPGAALTIENPAPGAGQPVTLQRDE
jgi:hypothetical protein